MKLLASKVAKVGSNVTDFKPGDSVGVGCLVDSCRACPDCQDNLEQFCNNAEFTYNSPDKHSGGTNYGGYSRQIVVDQDFVLHVSDKLDLAAVAPLLCAGITTYSPLRHWKVGKGDKVGIVGLGGLATWASNSPMRLAPTSGSLLLHQARQKMPNGSERMKWSYPKIRMRCKSMWPALTSS